ncbi:MAG: type II toxin-antitoxin system HicB family antitoxin [Deltaproteobacteria bacterium]|nr:type II toxin-antitoxin system HicB family antitoxin [Deltaproteobacteria bacterium]
MKSAKYVYWQEGDTWIGYLEEYPDYWTQVATLEELEENLKDLYKDLHGNVIPCVRRVAELKVA